MSSELITAEAAATRLGLHVKTVLRFIREGRLKAHRVGRQYRILKGDLDAFAGTTAPAAPQDTARVTAIVDLPTLASEQAQAIARRLSAARMGGRFGAPLSMDFAHDPVRQTLKLVLVGDLGDVAEMLQHLDQWAQL